MAHTRGVDAVGAERLFARPPAIQDGRIADPARVECVGTVVRELPPRFERTRARFANRASDGVSKLAPRPGERDTERVFRRGVEQPRNEVVALVFDEFADVTLAARAREIVDEERSVCVRGLAEREMPLAEAPRADVRERAVDRRRARDHPVLGSEDAARAGEVRLLVDGHSLEQPRRRVQIRKRRRRATEDVLAERPDAAHAIEVEDVRQLVRDHQLRPIVRVAERRLRDRRIGVDDDAIRRKRRGVSVGEVGVVGEDDVDHPTRRMELVRQLVVRPLGVSGESTRDRLEGRIEVDSKMLGGEGGPV